MCPTSSPINITRSGLTRPPLDNPALILHVPGARAVQESHRVGPLTSPPHTVQVWSLIRMRWLKGLKSGSTRIRALHCTNPES